jgi:3-methyladenine DNA glycosylase Tag
MQSFDKILAKAAAHKGGDGELQALLALTIVRTPVEIAAMGDDRILSELSKRVFQAGFNWKVVESKWAGFEEAFESFDVTRNVFMSDNDFDSHLANPAIIRHAKKILTVRDNAVFLSDLVKEYGSAAKAFADWPVEDHVGLLALMKNAVPVWAA